MKMFRYFPLLLLPVIAGCSGQGPDVVAPGAEERNQTAILALGDEGNGELGRYYEADEALLEEEYATANGTPLGLDPDAIYERYEKLWVFDNDAGTIAVLNLLNRKEIGRIEGLPNGDSGTAGHLNGLAFSNLSQAWAIAYGSGSLFHIDAQNIVAVRRVDLPGEPTAITTIDNRVFIGLEMADGTGAIGLMRSNDPDLGVQVIATMRRPPVFTAINADQQHIVMLVPGEEADLPETGIIDTDPALMLLTLSDYSFVFDGRIIAPNLRDYVGRHPVFATATKDYFLYLATSEGVKRIDTQAWGDFIDFLPGKAYSVVAADYYTDLVYAVPTSSPTTIERITKHEDRLSDLNTAVPVNAITFVSTSKVNR